MGDQEFISPGIKDSDNGPIFNESSSQLIGIKFKDKNFTNKAYLSEDLSPIEHEVLKIAQEILKLKRYSVRFEINSHCQIRRYPILEKLYTTCIAKLCYSHNYSKEGIFQAIKNLDDKNWIISNHRRTKKEILANNKYKKILKFIQNNPGIYASDKKVERCLRLTRTPFLKYIKTLEKFGLIRSTKYGKKLHFFLIDFPISFDKITILLSNPLIYKIICEIIKNPHISINQIGRNLDHFPNAIQYHLRKLQKENLIKIETRGFKKQNFVLNLPLLEKYMQINQTNRIEDLLNLYT